MSSNDKIDFIIVHLKIDYRASDRRKRVRQRVSVRRASRLSHPYDSELLGNW